jgi:hypothetical protein
VFAQVRPPRAAGTVSGTIQVLDPTVPVIRQGAPVPICTGAGANAPVVIMTE